MIHRNWCETCSELTAAGEKLATDVGVLKEEERKASVSMATVASPTAAKLPALLKHKRNGKVAVVLLTCGLKLQMCYRTF